MRRKLRSCIRIGFALGTIVLLGAQPVRWGDHGHRISARAAVTWLPAEMPAFFRQAADELEYLNPEPDRWRSDRSPEMRDAYQYDHFIDFELVPPQAMRASSRFAYLAALQRAGTTVSAGLLPFRIVELHQRLTTEFRRWRAAPDAQQRTWIERRIIQDAGILGHYVTDGANPHHTTVHHNGWAEGYPNPNGFTMDRQFHRRFESEYVGARIRAEELLATTAAPVRVIQDVRAETFEHLNRSHALLERLYVLDGEASFGEANQSPAHHQFAVERLAAGAAMLRDLWWSAWVNSAQPR
ncbi:MAG: hypothetical protein ACREMQ_09220 [Longimicrobiales bacterium]